MLIFHFLFDLQAVMQQNYSIPVVDTFCVLTKMTTAMVSLKTQR
jgi:hypothetical protein